MPHIPNPVGPLMVRLSGDVEVVQVVPKVYGGEQKRRKDGTPIWLVRMLYTGEDGVCDLISASVAEAEEPADLEGVERTKSTLLGARFWQLDNGRCGWSYNLDGALIKQFRGQ